MLGAGGIGGDKGQVDVGAGGAGKLDLGLFGGFLQALSSHFILAQVNAVFLLEVIGHPVDHALVKVVAAQMGVAVGSQNLGHAVAHFDDGNIEGAAAQVIHHDLLIVFLIHAVCQCSGSGLVDDTLYIQAGNGACVLGCLTLAVVEVSGNGDHSFGNRLAQISLSIGLQLSQDHSADLFGGVVLIACVYLVRSAHVALDGGNGVFRIGDSLTLCHLTHQTVAVLSKAHHRRGGACAFGVGDNNGLAALDHSHTAVGSTKVNTNNFAHKNCSSLNRNDVF